VCLQRESSLASPYILIEVYSYTKYQIKQSEWMTNNIKRAKRYHYHSIKRAKRYHYHSKKGIGDTR